MKKIILATIVLILPLSVFASWDCETEADCSKGMKCSDGSCIVDASKFSSYAVVTIRKGASSPNDLGSNHIYVSHPAEDIVLGQLNVEAVHGGADGQYFLFKELNLKISGATKVIAADIKLVYDANANGVFDSNEEIVAIDESEQKNSPKLIFDQKKASYLMNTSENFLIVGDFYVEGVIDQSFDFGVTFSPFVEKTVGEKIPQVVISNAGDVALTSVPENIIFPRFVFEPESGYFLLSSGKHFPEAPIWPEMNAVHKIMHLRAKALDRDNELKALNIRLDGTVVSYGNGVKRITVYLDDNNDGKGDSKLVEYIPEVMASQVLLSFPAGSVSLKKGEEAFLVVEAELEFYSGQVTKFYISKNGDVQLVTPENIIGVTVSTEEFSYNCDETDENCRLKPDENTGMDDEGGCSLVLFD